MPSFGEKLRLEREKRKITLDQVSSSTKIGTRMLQALEEDRFSQLPGGIFNKGFVRAYARFVGLDEEQAVADYLEASGEAAPVRSETMGRENAARAAPPRIIEDNSARLEIRAESASRQLPWGWFAVILLAVALALSLWNHRRREQEKSAQRSLPAKAAVQESPTPPSAPSPTGNGSSIQPSSIGTQTNPAGAQANSTPAPVPAAPDQKPSQPVQPLQTVAAAVPAPGEFTLLIQAREESWISLTVDGKHAGSETLAAGTQRTVFARKEVVVRAGNAGGLDFLLNGKKVAVGGEFGEVKTVTIGPAGLLPNSPAESTTP